MSAVSAGGVRDRTGCQRSEVSAGVSPGSIDEVASMIVRNGTETAMDAGLLF